MDSLLKETQTKAEGGDTSAMIHLARWHYAGEEGLNPSPQKSFEWVLKAAEAGDPIAQRMVAMKFEHGEGVKQDPVAAFEWYRKAYEGGDANACYFLGTYFENDEKGMQPHLPTAINYFEEGAKRGCSFSQYNLGFRALSGQGIARNPVRAVDLLEEAGRNGIPSAYEALGRLYLEGRDVPRDPDTAFDAFTRALEFFDIDPAISSGDCALYYALCLLTGTGCEKNAKLGKEVLEVASAAGNLVALRVLQDRVVKNPQVLACFGVNPADLAKKTGRADWDISSLLK